MLCIYKKVVMEKQFISLGTLCHTAETLKKIGLRQEAMPFDWVFSTPSIIKNCLDTKFEVFRDRTLYCKTSYRKSGHVIYGPNFFNHKDITCECDYQYYKRTIERFNKLDENAVFVIGFYNNAETESNLDYIEKSVEYIKQALEKYFGGKKHKLVCIHHKVVKDVYRIVSKKKNDGLLWIDLCCIETNGVRFLNKRVQKHFEKDMKNILCTGDEKIYEKEFGLCWICRKFGI
jgi:hypothetical protein